MEEKELSLIDKNISSLLEVPLRPTITSLNLHCNRIPRIEGLTSAWLLRHLDLSSNCIAKIEGLASLTTLRTLNLSCNAITKVEGLTGLVNLTKLDLSFNQINDLSGLLHLHGPGRKLKHLSLHSNRLGSIEHLLQSLLGLQGLSEVLLSHGGKDNPLCKTPGYREMVMQSLPQVSFLDGLDRLGQPSYSTADSPCDIPGLENYVDLLLLSDAGNNEVVIRSNELAMNGIILMYSLTQASARHKSSQPSRSAVKARAATNDTDRTSESDCDSGKENGARSAIPKYRKPASTTTTSTFWMCISLYVLAPSNLHWHQAIVEERDRERERRWKAQQAVTKLTDELKCLKTKVSEEKDLQSMAMHTTDRYDMPHWLHFHNSTRHASKKCLFFQMKRQQELENKVVALSRELDVQRAKVQQLHELLACREQEHRKQLELRPQPGGTDFLAAVAREVASEKQSYTRRESELKDKVEEGKKAYAALEDEFRMALTFEAARFSEVKKAYDEMTAELPELRVTLAQSRQAEKKSASLAQELAALVEEQKSRITELINAKRNAVTEFKRRARALEADLDRDRRLRLQLEALKKDKARLSSQLGAQESVIDGLRAERRLWGQELAQQGASLAQDRGRLEARIEALGAEVEAQKKQIDQHATGTLRPLRVPLRDDNAQAEKTFQRQLREETSRLSELEGHVRRLSLRKEELKQQLADKEAQVEEVKRVHGESTKKWHEKAQLLTQLESQVKRMKENFESKERTLLEENEQLTEAHGAAVEKLRCMDDAFCAQLQSLQAAHQAELLQMANDKHDRMEEANQKVFEVEEEMRQLLLEVEANKRITEEKMKRLNSVLKDLNW
uniref:Leucine-rich repeat and coiled-coil domain-containing protein 1 n=1 Tax=Hippocampus comes TaxID=109280 RepID=A0A3Q2YL99_HIPCM